MKGDLIMYMGNDDFKLVFRGQTAVLNVRDLDEVLSLVKDLFEYESDALEASEPYARRTIEKYRDIGREISMMSDEFLEKYEEVFGK